MSSKYRVFGILIEIGLHLLHYAIGIEGIASLASSIIVDHLREIRQTVTGAIREVTRSAAEY